MREHRQRELAACGYEATWAGLVEAQPNPPRLHALITPLELLHLTFFGHVEGQLL